MVISAPTLTHSSWQWFGEYHYSHIDGVGSESEGRFSEIKSWICPATSNEINMNNPKSQPKMLAYCLNAISIYLRNQKMENTLKWNRIYMCIAALIIRFQGLKH